MGKPCRLDVVIPPKAGNHGEAGLVGSRHPAEGRDPWESRAGWMSSSRRRPGTMAEAVGVHTRLAGVGDPEAGLDRSSVVRSIVRSRALRQQQNNRRPSLHTVPTTPASRLVLFCSSAMVPGLRRDDDFRHARYLLERTARRTRSITPGPSPAPTVIANPPSLAPPPPRSPQGPSQHGSVACPHPPSSRHLCRYRRTLPSPLAAESPAH